MMGDEQRRAASDALSRVEEAGVLLAFLAAHLAMDPGTSRIGQAIEGIGVIRDKASTGLTLLSA